jgi:hypothetical protein
MMFYPNLAEMNNSFYETGHSRDTVYKRIYDIKKKGVTLEISTPKKATNATATPKKRKVATDAEEDF